jgi:hypothetical protein
MKHLTLACCALAAVMTTQAQRLVEQHSFAAMPAPLSATEIQQQRDPAMPSSIELATRGGGVVLFSEDFANGLDGNNGGFGAWTAEDTGGGLIWQWVDPTGDGYYADGTASGVTPPAGEYSTNINPLASTTGDNGWMIFDCDYFNTPISEGFENTEGWITSPTLDFSANSSVVVTWEQYFRYCCYPFAPVFLQVSNDAGATWTTFDGHGSFIESANTASANALTTSVDISCAAAGFAEVQIRFAYLQPDETGDGYSHYYWGIDDVVISENPVVNDLSVIQITNGDIFNLFEYRHTPLEQAIPAADGGLVAGVLYRNAGNADQDEAVVTVNILDATGGVLATVTEELGTLSSFANAANCPANPQDTVYITTGWEPPSTGEYVLQVNLAQAAADENPEDNTMMKVFYYTDDEYGHDDEMDLNTEFRPRESDIAGLFEPCGYGSFFHMHNTGSTAYGVTVRFGPSSGGGLLEFETRLYDYDPELGLTDSPFESTYWEYDDSWTPADAESSEFVYLAFEDAIELDNEGFYFAGVISEFESESELTVLGNADSDTDNSTGSYSQAGSGDFVWFTSQTATPAVRLILSERVGVDEIANANGIQLFQNAPNPANGTTMFRFEMLQARNVSLEIRDLQGRIVDTIERGQLSAGEHQVQYDVTALGGGIYTYTLIADGMRMTKKFIVQ